jgi:hypothetical protein
MLARVMTTLELEVDDPAGAQVLEAGGRPDPQAGGQA